MKRVLKTMLFLVVVGLLVYGFVPAANATVSGVCSNCHTMHYSQNGTTPAGASGGPNGHLTLSSCLGCHGASGSTVGGAPNIFGTATITAGGTFNTATASTMAKRHDVTDVFAGGDTTYGANGTPGNSGSLITLNPNQLNCAGTTGCHGDHTAGKTTSDAGIKGFHHSKTAGYRYLQTSAGTAITGLKSSDWEATVSATNHNVYSADTNNGISRLCAQCHGAFHGTGTGTGDTAIWNGSAWIRHPVEMGFGGLTGGTASIAADYVNTPFGFANADFATVTPTSAYTATSGSGAQVVCVSCHRAHGSANDDILRFAYSTQIAGGGGSTGCLNCHVNQR